MTDPVVVLAILGAGWLAAAGATALVLRFLFGDRRRAARRCPKCWYDLTQTGGLQCPECGHTASSEQQLRRSRRRARHVLFALLLGVASIPLLIYPRAQTRGWYWPIPTGLLATIAPHCAPDSLVSIELETRIGIRVGLAGRPPPTNSDILSILRRAVRGIPGYRPPSKAWQETYGKLLTDSGWHLEQNNQALMLEAAPLLAEFREMPFLFEPRTRDRWPIGMPVTVTPLVKTWWDYARCSTSISLRWSARTSNDEDFGPSSPLEYPNRIDNPPTGDVELTLEAEVFRHDDRTKSPRTSMGRVSSTIRYRTVGTLAEAIELVNSPTLDTHLLQALQTGFDAPSARELSSANGFPTLDWVSMWNLNHPRESAGVVFGGRLDVLHNQRVVGSRSMRWWVNTGGHPTHSSWIGEVTPADEAQAYFRAHQSEPGWTIRFTSDPAIGLLEIEADKLWQGQVEFPWTPPAPAATPVPVPAK